MTMPHLTNCPHQADGHCLECVVQDYTLANGKIESLKAELASLNSVRYEHDAILKSPDGLMALMAIHDCKESEAEAFGDIGDGSAHRARRESLKKMGREIVKDGPEIWTDEILRAFGFSNLVVNRCAKRIAQEGTLVEEPGLGLESEGVKSLANTCSELDSHGKALPEFKPKVVVVTRRGNVTYAGANIELEVIIHNTDNLGREHGEEVLELVSKGCNECDLTNSSDVDWSAV